MYNYFTSKRRSIVFALCLLCATWRSVLSVDPASHSVSLTLGSFPTDIVVGNIKVFVPSDAFGESVTHTISTYSYDTQRSGEQPASTSKRSHSADCPYDWMVWCYYGPYVNWSTSTSQNTHARSDVFANQVAFEKPVTIRYYPTEDVDQGDFWVAVDMNAESEFVAVPAREQILGEESFVEFNITKPSSYAVMKLTYSPTKNCPVCTQFMNKCLDYLAVEHGVRNICSLNSTTITIACEDGTAPLSCSLLCQHGEVENIWNPLTDILCASSHSYTHAYITKHLCHYYEQC